MLIMVGLQCGSHLSALWTSVLSVYVKYCTHAFPFVLGFVISNFLLDLLILLLPVPQVKQRDSILVKKLQTNESPDMGATYGLGSQSCRDRRVWTSFNVRSPISLN